MRRGRCGVSNAEPLSDRAAGQTVGRDPNNQALVAEPRGGHNRLGFALLLTTMRLWG